MTTTNKSAIRPQVKPVGRLDASMLLARKGEAQPAVAATTQNNPSLAWGVYTQPADAHHPATAHRAPEPQPQSHQARPHPAAPSDHAHKPTASAARLRPDSFVPPRSSNGVKASALQAPGRAPVNEDRDPVALTLRVEDNTYLRLTYLAQASGKSVQQVLNAALEGHLIEHGLPVSRKLVVRPK